MVKLPDIEKSLWRESYPSGAAYPKLSEDMDIDVVIVGGGITGLTAGYLLKKSGYKVAVLEKDTIGSGTTGRTTGKVTSQHSIIYSDMAERLGKEAARIYGEANQTAVDTVGQIIKKEGIRCDWQMDDNYIFTTEKDRVSELRKEAEAAAGLGLPSTFETAIPLPFEVKGAVKFTGQGKINSQKYLLGLAEAVDGNGSYVYENSKVIDYHDGGKTYVRTRHARVTAKYIIAASKIPRLPLMARVGYALLEYPTESFAVACRLDKPVEGMYISPDSEHHSILPLEIDGKNMLVIVGAGGNIPGVRISKGKRYRRLADYAKKYFSVSDITNQWSDMDYLPYDYLPLVGRVYPWSKNMYMATGFLKWGLSNGTAAAMMLHDLVAGKKNPWTSTFESMRLRPITSFPRAAMRHVKK